MNKKLEEKYIEEMKNGCFSRDFEVNHGNADDLLIALLHELGYNKLANLWCEVDKWYA